VFYLASYFVPFLLYYSLKNFFKKNKSDYLFYILIFIFLLFFIGLRHEVGGDWAWYIFTQLGNQESNLDKGFFDIPKDSKSDIGYLAISHFSLKLDMGIYGVNLFCAFFLIYSILKYSSLQRLPWLTIMIAFPYILVVCGMGYVRQATALGFGILAIISLIKEKKLYFLLYIMAACLFHKTAIFFLIYLFSYNLFKNKYLLIISSIIGILFLSIFFDMYKHLIYYYIGPGQYMSSSGYLFRYSITFISAILFFIFYKNLSLSDAEKNIYFINSGLVLLFSFFLFFAPVFLDRINIYLSIIQLFIFSRLPFVFNNLTIQSFIIIIIVFFNFIYFLIWLVFATHSSYWLPYNNLFFIK
tara:strand:+ start:555 stop:1622 length:1068 start_codon:yes stop_codon:yes gene_type:complete